MASARIARQRKLRHAVAEHSPAAFGLTGLVVGPQDGGPADPGAARHRVEATTVGKYLRSWGLSPQKPIRRAYEQYPESRCR
ncbi:winged helix-turn-helix domain-containing protein [Saccharopolyspora sp. NPDC000995]